MDRILSFDSQFLIQTVVQLANTALMVAIITYLMYKPVKNFLQNRTDKINNTIMEAHNSLADAAEIKKSYEEKLANIEQERTEILEAAKKRAIEREKQIILSAEKEAETLKNRAMLEIRREQDKAKDEVKKQIIDISSLIASQYIAEKIDVDTQNKLLDNVISDLGDVKWLN